MSRRVLARRPLVAAMIVSLIGATAAALPAPAVGAASAVTCTFNGKPGPAPITGVVPGTTTIAISCTGATGLSLIAAQASPLGGFVIPPASATNEGDLATLTGLAESPPGTYTATFAVPATFSAADPNAVCPPSAGQFNAGLVGCAVAVINGSTLSPFPGQEAVLEFTGQTTPPNSPTLATSASTVTPGQGITFADATGACPSNPGAPSQCWWGDALTTSSTSASPPTLTVSLDGAAVPGASALVSGPGATGTATYDGTTLVPETLSGSLTLPSSLSTGTHTLTVAQTNITPFNGNGPSPAPGSPIQASATLTVGPSTGPTVTGLSPASGPSVGGTSVTITGTDLTGATAVHFGTAAASNVTVGSATSVTATSAPGAGTVDVTVTTPAGTSPTSNADRFTYLMPTAPTVTGLNPASGSQAGGTVVTVTGTGLTGATAVHFGKALAGHVKVSSDTALSATSPSGSGTVNVTVNTALGTSMITPADRYAYLPGLPAAPTVTAVTPAIGVGGTVVSVTGSAFTGPSFKNAVAVSFGPAAAAAVAVTSDTSLTATAPPGTVTGSAVDVTVTTPSGTSPVGSGDQFTYVTAPAVTGLTPSQGSPLGGYQTTISGSGFNGATEVDFGTTAATNVVVSGDGSITVTVPAGTGTVDVTVIAPGGTSAVSPADQFTYGAPIVTGLSQKKGSRLGGYPITVSGTGFTGATEVDFGTTAATNVVVSGDGSITVTVPAGTGTVDVTVIAPGGTSAFTPADQFKYLVAPAVSGVSPGQGPEVGGNQVTISGFGFTGAKAVHFGNASATNLTGASDNSVTVTAPVHLGGVVDVTVTVPGATSASSPADHYTYVAAPTVLAVRPGSGPASGGTKVIITGSGFATATEVDFGPGNPANFTLKKDGTIAAFAPFAGAGAGTVDITVINPGGASPSSAADRFTYLVPPTVSAVGPVAGPPGGGTPVVITGTGFTPGSTVAFGTVAATQISFVSANGIVVTSPAGTGTVDVTVTTSTGTSATSPADQFTYEGAPTVTAIDPSAGPLAGNVAVTVTGTNLTGASQVNFGTNASATVTVTSSTSLTAIAPSGLAGADDVTVITPSGTSATSSADLFTYRTAPTILGMSPGSGPVSGGTSVTITGSGFRGASDVSFGGTPATTFTVSSDASITATAPAVIDTAPFGATVTVTTPGGTGGSGGTSDTFTYTAVVPTVTGVSPSTNTSAGGSGVTITGTGFTNDIAVNFGSTPAIQVQSLSSPTSVVAISPGGPPGPVDITVSTTGGTSAISPADVFTYVNETATLTVTPNTGVGDGDTVTVTGTGFPTGIWPAGGTALVQASPLGALVTGFAAIEEIDRNAIVFQTVDNNGNFTTSFTLANPFQSFGDPNAACKPLQNQIDLGLVGCAVAGLVLNRVTFLAQAANAPIIFAGTQPDPPTLAVTHTTVHADATLKFTGTGWWGSFPGGAATAKICGLGGHPTKCDATTGSGVVAPTTYTGVGGTVAGATLSGSITVGSDLVGCTTCFLTVTQPNLTPVPGNVTAALALTITAPLASGRLPTDGPS